MLDNKNLSESETEIRIAIAGRSKSKLNNVLSTHLIEHSQKISTIVASIENEQSMIKMCMQTKVVISTVGP